MRTCYIDVDDDEAQRMVTSRMSRAKSDLAYVKEKLNTHGALVLSRWSKRSRDKRGRLLSTAAKEVFGVWPKIVLPHPPGHLEACKKQFGVGLWRMVDRFLPKSNAYGEWKMGSWLNITELIEDRMKPFALLYARKTYSLQDWFIFDTSQNAGMWSISNEPLGLGPCNSRCVQIHGEDFGRLVPFDSDLAHARAIIGFPRAYITIVGQLALAQALRKVVDAIVMDGIATGNSTWIELMTNAHGLQHSSGERHWSPYVHPGYTPPICLDAEALLQASRGRFNQIVDEVELMQTDPEYMYNYVSTLKAGINWDQTVPTSLKWAYISQALLRTRGRFLITWQRLVNECQSFQAVCKPYEQGESSAIVPGSRMAADVRKAFENLCAVLYSRQLVLTMELGSAFSDMDAMKDHYKKAMVDGELRNVIKSPEIQNPDMPGDRILPCFRMLQDTMANSRLYGAKKWGDMLREELSNVQSSQRSNEGLSSLALIDAMRMSAIWGCQALVESTAQDVNPDYMARPEDEISDTHFLPEYRKTTGTSRPGSSAKAAVWLETLMTAPLVPPDSIGRRLGPLLQDFCNSPWPKSGSGPIWLAKATKSRELLSNLWQAVRDEWPTHFRQTSKVWPEAMISNMSFDLSPRYLAVVAAERRLHEADDQQVRCPTTPAPTNAASDTPTLQSTLGVSNTCTDPVRKKRTKSKLARTLAEELSGPGTPSSSSRQHEPLLQETSSQTPTIPKIPVKQESLSVFNKMFSSGGSISIRWIQLVQALTDAGMTATQVPGSGVKFANDHDSIVLHRPHPVPVLDAVMLRCHIGKRLHKWFGWDRDSFVLRVKDVEVKNVDETERGAQRFADGFDVMEQLEYYSQRTVR